MWQRKNIGYLFLLLLSFHCRKPYEPAVTQVDFSYLVIDGVINATPNSITEFKLSRTTNLADSLPPAPEPGATVMIEAETGGAFPLLSQGNGIYRSGIISLNPSLNYQLKVATSNGKNYESDYVPVKQTPPIDSITWKQKLDSPNKGVTIFAHTHDPQNKTTFYRWDYVETWEYQPPLIGYVSLNSQGRAFYTDSTNQINTCWGTTYSNNISIASSEALGQDLISYAPIQMVPQNDERMAIRYSIYVNQYALTREAYQYWDLLKKSTEQTGSIFDPQPAQLIGNIHCVSNPNEPVIGFASASYVTGKRMFIGYRELADWHYQNNPGSSCKINYWPTDPVDFSIFNYPDTSSQPWYYSGSYTLVVKKDCVDCRRRGGTNQKPSFW